MQRIARLQQQHADKVLDGHADLQRLLRRTLPPSTVNMYAKPRRLEDGYVEWYSEMGGQPVSLAQLAASDPPQAAQARRLLAERLAAVQQMADSWPAQGVDAAQGERARALLQAAAQPPQDKNVYVLDGQPVITLWGGHEPPESLVTAPLAAASLAMPRKRRLWPWLLALLLLALLLAALGAWWWWCRTPPAPALPAPVMDTPTVEAPAMPPPAAEPAPAEASPDPGQEPVSDPVSEPAPQPAPEPAPEPAPQPVAPPEPPKPKPAPPRPDPVAALRQRIARADKDCNALQQLQKTEPLLKTNQELRAQLDKQLLQYCKTQVIDQAKNLCPAERPPELAPELVIVFDASGSMDISLLATPEEIRRASATQTGVNLIGGVLGIPLPNPALRSVTREPKRITGARQATTAIVEQLSSDVSAGLVLVEQCPAARSVGFFSPGQRGQLTRQINAITPKGGTPLADGIRRAGAMLDGVNRESVMLVVSDGDESCGQDPCAAARELARRKPHLKINVVDILGTGAGNCLAAATGGQVFTANTLKDLQLSTRQAARDVLPPAHCKP